MSNQAEQSISTNVQQIGNFPRRYLSLSPTWFLSGKGNGTMVINNLVTSIEVGIAWALISLTILVVGWAYKNC